MRLRDKVAIVTGAGQGLGRATSRVLASEGASVALVDWNEETAGQAADDIVAAGGKAIAVKCDVRRREQVDAAVAATAQRFGGIHILVQYAQIIRIEIPLEEIDDQAFADSLDSGLMGTFYFMQSAFPHLRASGVGRIVNVSSAAGMQGTPGCAAYASAKEAIRGLTRVAAREWGRHGITVNAICPFARTPAMDVWQEHCPDEYNALLATCPLGRLGDAEADIGRAILAIVTDLQYVTGSTFVLDGGQHPV